MNKSLLYSGLPEIVEVHRPVLAENIARLWSAYFHPEQDEKPLAKNIYPTPSRPIPSDEKMLYVDATLGEAGHARLLLQQQPKAHLLGIDADPYMLERGRYFLEQTLGMQGLTERCQLICQYFSDYLGQLKPDSLQANLILFDLGISLFHYAAPRGFSFRPTNPEEELDMRLNPAAGAPKAADLIQNLSEGELADIFWRYGELTNSRSIARAIVRQRSKQNLRKAQVLANFICRHFSRSQIPRKNARGRNTSRHPATQIFQALRIAVGDELGQLANSLPTAFAQLRQNGLLAVITFHSLEDRLVKQQFRSWQEKGLAQWVYKKAIQAPYNTFRTSERSAKLRVVRRMV